MINIAFCKSASLSKMELKGEKKQGGREKAFINKKQINFNQMIRRKAKHPNTYSPEMFEMYQMQN